MGYETKIVHPAVEAKLKYLEFEYNHEVALPLSGRADFIAHDLEANEWILIECKRDCSGVKKTIAQILAYNSQIKCEHMVIIVPRGTRTASAIQLCEQYNIMLLVVDVLGESLYNCRRKLKAFFG